MTELDADTLHGLWRRMLRIRHFERRVSAIAEANAVDGYLHTYAGQEAVACGIIPLLRDDDWFTSTYRNHGHAIARDIPMEAIAGELYGRATGVCQGKGGSMHVADQHRGMIGGMGIVAGGLPIATGAAFAAAYLGEDRVAVAFFGDGAVHQGAWHEALDFAGLFQCPVIFVCENNLYAETTAVDYHLLADSVTAMTAPTIASLRPRSTAWTSSPSARPPRRRHRARPGGGGPTLIEAMTYRYGGQYEGDTQTYKPPDRGRPCGAARDPLPRSSADRHRTPLARRRPTRRHRSRRWSARSTPPSPAAEAAPWPDLSTSPPTSTRPTDRRAIRCHANCTIKDAINEALRQEMEPTHASCCSARTSPAAPDATTSIPTPPTPGVGHSASPRDCCPGSDASGSSTPPSPRPASSALPSVQPSPDCAPSPRSCTSTSSARPSTSCSTTPPRLRYVYGGKVSVPMVVRTVAGAGFRAGRRTLADALLALHPRARPQGRRAVNRLRRQGTARSRRSATRTRSSSSNTSVSTCTRTTCPRSPTPCPSASPAFTETATT